MSDMPKKFYIANYDGLYMFADPQKATIPTTEYIRKDPDTIILSRKALEGMRRGTGMIREDLHDRNTIWNAAIDKILHEAKGKWEQSDKGEIE